MTAERGIFLSYQQVRQHATPNELVHIFFVCVYFLLRQKVSNDTPSHEPECQPFVVIISAQVTFSVVCSGFLNVLLRIKMQCYVYVTVVQ